MDSGATLEGYWVRPCMSISLNKFSFQVSIPTSYFVQMDFHRRQCSPVRWVPDRLAGSMAHANVSKFMTLFTGNEKSEGKRATERKWKSDSESESEKKNRK